MNATISPPTELCEPACTEAQVRKMRDEIYGNTSSDQNWAACRKYWLAPENTKWIWDQYTKLPY